MTVHPARIAASVLLLAAGILVSVFALAVVVADMLVDAGARVTPADASLLADLIGVLPLIVGFAAVTLLAAMGLLSGSSWATTLANASAVVAVVTGAVGILLIVVGRDPFVPVASGASVPDGLVVVAAFTVVYLLVIVALAVARQPRTANSGAAA